MHAATNTDEYIALTPSTQENAHFNFNFHCINVPNHPGKGLDHPKIKQMPVLTSMLTNTGTDTSSETFPGTKFFRYRFRDFFRYHFFPIPVPILFSGTSFFSIPVPIPPKKVENSRYRYVTLCLNLSFGVRFSRELYSTSICTEAEIRNYILQFHLNWKGVKIGQCG